MCIYMGSVRRGVLFLFMLGIGFVILLWHSLGIHMNITWHTSNLGGVALFATTVLIAIDGKYFYTEAFGISLFLCYFQFDPFYICR